MQIHCITNSALSSNINVPRVLRIVTTVISVVNILEMVAENVNSCAGRSCVISLLREVQQGPPCPQAHVAPRESCKCIRVTPERRQPS